MRSYVVPKPTKGRSTLSALLSRRRGWIMENVGPRQAANMLLAASQYALRSEVMRAWPVVAKVDISPLCNLRCTMCLHARPSEGSDPLLGRQHFSAGQHMSIDRYRDIVGELSGRTSAVSLFYMGDPLMHPHLEEICEATARGGMNSHLSTNFSFGLSDERLRSLVASGMTHLKVCVDGITQETYGRTRVGGRIAVVLDNLRRLMEIRRRSGGVYPRVEVQYIKFQHNLGELDEARTRCLSWGVDQFTEMWGVLHNLTDAPEAVQGGPTPRRGRIRPRCAWPYFSLVVRYDGGVIPCCIHRSSTQYTADPAERRELGNVFESGVWAVWNSPAYRALRRLSVDPARSLRDPALAHTFCEQCPTLFTYNAGHIRRAETARWEDEWEQDDRGRVTRKQPLVQLGGDIRPGG